MAPVGNTEIWLLIIANATLLGRDVIKVLRKNSSGAGTKIDVRVGASGNQTQNGGGGNGKGNGAPKLPCHEHGESIVELRTKLKGYESNLEIMRRENREDHQKLFDELRSRGE